MTNPRIDGAAIEAQVLANLKGFQRKTVDHVFKRMYQDTEPTTRFLVADEVGLGKTLVARGVIARAINYHQSIGTQRIDIVYICSNAEIAAQNIRRLNVTGERGLSLATRITLLPLTLNQLTTNGVNFVSFTPGTSFNMASQGGKSDERAVIFRLLEFVMDTSLDRPGAYRALRNHASDQSFRWRVGQTPRVSTGEGSGLDQRLAIAFKEELQRQPELLERFRLIMHAGDEQTDDVDRVVRQKLIGELRQTLARSCVEALEPDLIILDEFQQFRDLLDEPSEEDPDDIRHLAHHLFRQKDARTLLLSATPYKMYTLRDEEQDDHYADFIRTARFLMGGDQAKELTDDLREFRLALMDVGRGGERLLLNRKRRIEARLSRYISRTERIAVNGDDNGMLADHLLPETKLTASDLRSYAVADQISQRLGAGDVTDYWKSSPYLLNYMTDYKLKKSLRNEAENPALVSAVDSSTLLRRDHHEAYERIDPGNARLRGLLADTVNIGSWRLLWLPPSLPYYRGRGAYAEDRLSTMTKRLIFSSWNVVPDAISTILSYEAERQMMLSRDPAARNTSEDRAKLRGLLSIRRQGEKPAGMSTFGLMYPCATLAEYIDPLALARDLGAATREVDLEEIWAAATTRVEELLAPLTRRASKEGPEDHAWYWAAPLLLDRRRSARNASDPWIKTSDILQPPGSSGDETEDELGAWADHVAFARTTMDKPTVLGRVPADLAKTVALLGLGAPGTCGLRSIVRLLARRSCKQLDFNSLIASNAAFRIAWGFRSLFNVPEVMALLRGQLETEGEVYWRRVAEEGLHGNLQAVLDEYAYLLPEWLGLIEGDPTYVVESVSGAIYDAVSLRAVNYRPDEVKIEDGLLTFRPLAMRARFALRFGRSATDDEKVLLRSGAVRSAFNSPFWPFVLSSTSVGQEGLDFHQYCHAIVHWNLPANPVDMEQREGRIHRYKGHAIRKNVAERNRAAAFARRSLEPWTALFAEAVRKVPRGGIKDIQPFWVYEGSAKIERHVPLLPLSREVEQFSRLRRSLAAYRLVFGQPRQEDLADYLGDRIEPEELSRLIRQLSIDLKPPG